jgi:uncharacterized protein YjbI with pentapeptide repeats
MQNDTISMYIVLIDHNYNEEAGNEEPCDKKVQPGISILRRTLPDYVESNYPGASLTTQHLIERLIKHSLWLNSDSLTVNSRADFSGMYLPHVKMQGVNLSYSDLSHAVLDSADIIDIDLSVSEMLDVHLKDAKMQRAGLSYAELINADLSGAKLKTRNNITS